MWDVALMLLRRWTASTCLLCYVGCGYQVKGQVVSWHDKSPGTFCKSADLESIDTIIWSACFSPISPSILNRSP